MIVNLVDDPRLVGNKAANLAKAKKLEVKIPKSIVVSTNAFKHYKRSKDFLDRLLNNLEESIKAFRRPLIFRSSATIEDSLEKSYAGVFKSVLNIYTREDMKNAIKDIYNSFLEKTKEGEIAILVQEQFLKGKFGVIFGFDDKIVLEVTLNDPEGITKGSAKIKDLYIIDEKGTYIYNNRNWKILFDIEIEKIEEIDKKLRKIIYPYDAEFVIYKGEFYLLQIRHLTKKPSLKIGRYNLYGIGVSYGKAIGRVTFSYENRGKDKILVTEEVCIDDIDVVKEFGGVIMELGSLLSHLAIHAREYNIPSIIGVPVKYFKEGELIEIDGETGEIKFLERKGFELPKLKKEIEIFDPKKFQLLIIDKYSFLLYPKDGYKVAFYRDNRSLELLLRISEDPIVDGGVDTWHAYHTILELSLLDYEIKRDFEKVIEAIDKSDIEKIKKLYNTLKIKMKEYYKYAEKYKDLFLALKTYAYIRLIGNVLLFEYGQKLKDNKEFMDFVKETEKEEVPEFYKIYDLFNEIYEKIRKKYRLDKRNYTSDIAFLADLDRVSLKGSS